MYPELFEIPLIHLTVKSYGLMLVIGFLGAVSLIRYLSRDITRDPQLITNAALYLLVAGVVGARLFYVLHHLANFRYDPVAVFKIWQGGLELLGGVILAVLVVFFYLVYHKLPIRRYLDVLAMGLMLALVFGRLGCFLNGCCYGKPTELPWGVRFPYYSFAYQSQINPDQKRNRPQPQLELPDEFFGYHGDDGGWISGLKPKQYLTESQKAEVTEGKYRCLPVHPTQLYSSAMAAFWCLVLYLFWRRARNAEHSGRILTKPGGTFALMLIVYGVSRFLIELLRDDNPFEFDGLTISQNLGIGMVVLGMVLMVVFQSAGSKSVKS
ncbi:MAG: prolipoprotein diacylglyceryl transferase [Planctomycetota bacterium]